MPLPYRKLGVWQRARTLALEVDRETRRETFRREWTLRDQIRRAAFSIGANIAEGSGRNTRADYASFLDRARGSLFELDHWLLLCRDIDLITPARHKELEDEISQLSAMIHAMTTKLRTKQPGS